MMLIVQPLWKQISWCHQDGSDLRGYFNYIGNYIEKFSFYRGVRVKKITTGIRREGDPLKQYYIYFIFPFPFRESR
jgi:hypothetical protein